MGIHAACCDDLVKALTPSLLQKNIQTFSKALCGPCDAAV